MSKPYDVDDILQEVKKRREENEAQLKSQSEPAEEKGTDENSAPEAEAAEPSAEDIIEETARDFDPQEQTEAAEAADAPDEYEDISSNDAKPAEEKAQPPQEYEDISSGAEKTEEIGEPETEPIDEPSPDGGEAEETTDLFELSVKAEAPEYEELSFAPVKVESKKQQSKTSKILKKIIFTLLVLILAALVGAYFYIDHALNNVSDNQNSTSLEEWTGMDELHESFNPIYEDEKTDVASYKDMVKKWYYNGTPASSTHVLNVLLIGEDTRDDEIADDETRADSAIIVSVNIDTQEITLTSILRDSYCYYEVTEGDESSGKFDKINAAMSDGGIDCYIRAVEHLFKINIDNYVIVNFSSFERIIDSLGGVDVEMTTKEIKEINNNPDRYGDVYIEGEAGVLHLNGEQALAYCRIRKIDSDVVRGDRQKTVLLQLFEKAKTASTLKSVEVVNDLLPYVKTGYGKSEIIGIVKYALKNDWLTYSTQTHTLPQNETAEDGTVITTCKGGTYFGAWVWKVDYPLAAQVLQQKIYGKTSITLAEKRPAFAELSEANKFA